MKIYKKSTLAVLVGSAMCLATPAIWAAGCDAYPYTDGINVENVHGGTKIVATASASVSFDDVDSIKDARDEATMEAKAMISKFMTEDIKSDSIINKTVNETKSMTGNEKKVLRKETIERVKSLRNSSRALLRGVVPLGDCYTQAREVRVTVGIKPETIVGAGNLASGISDSVSGKQTPNKVGQSDSGRGGHSNGGARSEGVSQGLQGMDGYSNTKRLDNF